LNENSDPTRDEIRAALAGNLCRCTGYTQIFEAIELVADEAAGRPARRRAWEAETSCESQAGCGSGEER
jgi:carbon-monoxide dehydrogenase small subunit